MVRISQMVNESATSVEDLSRLIMSDTALAGQILRLVNSAYYGFPKRITTISEAVVVLGFNTIRNLVASVGVARAFQPRGRTALNRDKFWSHSLATAVAARTIARRRNLLSKQVEEAFVGGLLHDVGKLFLDQYFPSQYAVTMRVATTARLSIVQAENTSLGIQHIHVGKLIAQKWNFPPSLVAMISQHHHPASAKEHFEFVAIIHAADRVAYGINLGDGANPTIPALDPDVEKWLRFTAQTWEAIDRETLYKYQDAQDFLQIAAPIEARAA
jgi:putative nucleotidyltransferase with HDIG domain